MTTLAHNSTVRVSCFESREADAWETHQAMMKLEVLLDAKQCGCCAADLPHGETGLCEDCYRDRDARDTCRVIEAHTAKDAVVDLASDNLAYDDVLDW